MNERITELVEQATSKPQRSQGFNGEPTHIYPGTFDPEKFAELLVDEFRENFAKVWYEQGFAARGYNPIKFLDRFDEHLRAKE